jgi:ATP phosphoribosyltransferase regulatory subunit
MTEGTAQKFAALEAQAHTLMSVFQRAGYEAVAPAIIQPAGIFLDVIGEDLRSRTYVFTDRDGAELCLRPDLTVPTCRIHLARNGAAGTPARYCYNGPAFRYQPQDADESHPREFRQAGIEVIGGDDAESAETEVLSLICQGLRAAGLDDFAIRIGDLGLFHALIDRLHIPDRWRQRLGAQFWRPDAFRAELTRLSTARTALPPVLAANAELTAALEANPATAAETVARFLDAQGLDLIGARTPREIAENLLGALSDSRAEPLSAAAVRLIESYLRISGDAMAAAASLDALAAGGAPELEAAIARYRRRIELMAGAGVPVDRMTFSAEFGRNLEYYTGLVFEVVVPGLGAASPVAGGGRYDDLMRAAGAATNIPAVGSAIHTERLLQAVSEVRR